MFTNRAGKPLSFRAEVKRGMSARPRNQGADLHAARRMEGKGEGVVQRAIKVFQGLLQKSKKQVLKDRSVTDVT